MHRGQRRETLALPNLTGAGWSIGYDRNIQTLTPYEDESHSMAADGRWRGTPRSLCPIEIAMAIGSRRWPLTLDPSVTAARAGPTYKAGAVFVASSGGRPATRPDVKRRQT